MSYEISSQSVYITEFSIGNLQGTIESRSKDATTAISLELASLEYEFALGTRYLTEGIIHFFFQNTFPNVLMCV